MHFISVKGRSGKNILINLDQIAAIKTEEFDEGVCTIIMPSGRSESIHAEGDLRSKITSAITKNGTVTNLT